MNVDMVSDEAPSASVADQPAKPRCSLAANVFPRLFAGFLIIIIIMVRLRLVRLSLGLG